ILATSRVPGPVYYRLGKDDQTIVPGLDGRFRLGRVEAVATGDDLVFVTAGAIAAEATAAATALAGDRIGTTVAIVSSFNTSSVEDLARLLGRFRLAVTVEAHYVTGGLGSLVAEIIADRDVHCRLVRFGIRQMSRGLVGSQEYLQRLHEI